MTATMTGVMLGLSAVGFNPDLLSKAVAPEVPQHWLAVDHGNGAWSVSGLDWVMAVKGEHAYLTSGEEWARATFTQTATGVRFDLLETSANLLVPPAVEVNADEEGALSFQAGEIDGTIDWDEGSSRLQIETEELGFAGWILGAIVGGAALFLVLCFVVLQPVCPNAINGVAPKTRTFQPFVCLPGLNCEF